MILNDGWAHSSENFLLEPSRSIQYSEFHESVAKLKVKILEEFVGKHAFALEAKNGFESYVRFISLLECGHAVALCPEYLFKQPDYRESLQGETKTDFIFLGSSEVLSDVSLPPKPRVHPDIEEGLQEGRRLFIVRTSGSSGKSYKYILHDADRFFAKYRKIGPHFKKTVAFSPFESIAGIETLLECLCHSRPLCVAGDRLSPAEVSALIQAHGVDYFQTTPSFLNLMVLARELNQQKLGSLKKIAFGSEPVLPSTLKAVVQELPGVELMHTYGMSEIGIQVTKTNKEDPTSILLDESFNPGRVRGGMLEVRSMTRMLGYLNASFSEAEGWFCTGDVVQEREGFFSVLGRADDTINVAGRKFLPSELESLIAKMSNVRDVTVRTEKSDFIGQVVTAEIILDQAEAEDSFRARFKKFSEVEIPFFMCPQRVTILTESRSGPRFKKMRKR